MCWPCLFRRSTNCLPVNEDSQSIAPHCRSTPSTSAGRCWAAARTLTSWWQNSRPRFVRRGCSPWRWAPAQAPPAQRCPEKPLTAGDRWPVCLHSGRPACVSRKVLKMCWFLLNSLCSSTFVLQSIRIGERPRGGEAAARGRGPQGPFASRPRPHFQR